MLTVIRAVMELARLNQHTSWTRQRLELEQQRKLRDLRSYAYQNSPFYREFHRGQYDSPLEELPVLTKKMMMENFDDLVTDHRIHLDDLKQNEDGWRESRYLDRYWVTTTSGSSGIPSLSLFNADEWVSVMASYARGQVLGGVDISLFRRNKFAFIVSPVSYHMSRRVITSLASPWADVLYLSSIEPIAALVQKLNDWQPQVLGTYASIARLLAMEQLAGRLDIHPRQVFTSAELLPDEVRKLIAAAWGSEPFNEYAATETAVIAAECRQHAGLHLYEDLLIVENVDEHYHPIPAGQFGAKVLVTVLFNRTQPLIRYELCDSVTFDAGASCGCCGLPFRRITAIQGRQEETLYLPSRSGESIPVNFTLFYQILGGLSHGSWQVVQCRDGLHIRLTEMNGDATELHGKLSQALEAYQVCVPEIYIESVASLARGRTGKLAAIVHEMDI